MDHLTNKAVKCWLHLISFNCMVSPKFLVFGHQHAIKRAVEKKDHDNTLQFPG
jgi:hypothetical protein